MKMTTVIAKGLINGTKMTIVCTGTNDNLTVTFNGEKDEHLLEFIRMVEHGNTNGTAARQ